MLRGVSVSGSVMLISVEKNFIFIHVAKTGGKSMKEALRPYAVPKARSRWRRFLAHLPIPEGTDAAFGPHVSAWWMKRKLPKDFFDGAFKFAFVRNPYDLAVSRYAFIRGHAEHHRHERLQTMSFGDYLRQEQRRAHRRPRDQTASLCDPQGRLIVDKVYRFEEMAEAYADIAARLRLDKVPEIPRKNASERGDYRSYYGEAERQIVEEIWRRDLDNFGYVF